MPRHNHPPRRRRRLPEPPAVERQPTPQALARSLVLRGLASPAILGHLKPDQNPAPTREPGHARARAEEHHP